MAQRIEHSDPVEAVLRTAMDHGISMYGHVAADIAAAVLASADSVVGVRQAADRHRWDIEDFREHLRARMRRQLLDEVTKTGRIPTALPSETVRYFLWPAFTAIGDGDPGTNEVPAEYADQADWQVVEVSLSVPVRTPPVDRVAVVKAGLLHG